MRELPTTTLCSYNGSNCNSDERNTSQNLVFAVYELFKDNNISHKKNIAYSVRKKDTMELIIIFCRRYEECAELYQLFRATQGRISLSHLLA